MRNTKKYLLAALGLVATCAMTSVFAAIPVPSGWYLEGNVGSSSVHNGKYVNGGSTSGSGLGWNVNAGFRFMPFFGAEIGYTKYADTDGKILGQKVAKTNSYSYDIAGKGILPISDTGAELFAKLGVVRINSHVKQTNDAFVAANSIVVNSGTHTSTNLLMGVGVEYAFLSNLMANIQWQRAKGNNIIGDLDLLSAGLGYTFD